MSAPSPLASVSEEGLAIYWRLRAGDVVAPLELVQLYLVPLLAWLEETNPRADPQMRETAVHEALLGLIKNPKSFDPDKGDLVAYLRRAAQCDLMNEWQRERRHHQHRRDWKVVEDPTNGGKYLGREEDPSLRLQRGEEITLDQLAQAAGLGEWTEGEQRVWELMIRGEKRTSVYAEALGLTELPVDEQEREVKRMKDRIMKRLKRAGGNHEGAA